MPAAGLLLLFLPFFAFNQMDSWTGDLILALSESQHSEATLRQQKGLGSDDLREGEAVIWYFGHSGWAVKTRENFLIFDYWLQGGSPSHRAESNKEPSLSNGRINPGEIKDQRVYIFVSHAHGDHFDEVIFDWEDKVEDITYIFGWQAADNPEHIYFGPSREKRIIGEIEVSTITHDFDGIPEAAFLVKVDGLVIFHSGDHGIGRGPLREKFKDNIDYLAGCADEFDLVFLPIFGAPEYAGVFYTLERLSPTVMFPMHFGGVEDAYLKFARTADEVGAKTNIVCAKARGDSYFYSDGKIKATSSKTEH